MDAAGANGESRRRFSTQTQRGCCGSKARGDELDESQGVLLRRSKAPSASGMRGKVGTECATDGKRGHVEAKQPSSDRLKRTSRKLLNNRGIWPSGLHRLTHKVKQEDWVISE